MAELLRRGVSDHRRALVGWCIGVGVYAALVAAIFPSIEGSADLDKLVESYPDALKALFGISEGGGFATGAGYIDTELFSFMLPLLALVLAIGSGARTLVGEEDGGRLELVLAYPVRRRDLVLAKGAAVGVEVAVFCTAAFVALALCSAAFTLELSLGRLAAAVGAVGVVALLHGWLALAVGAAVPSRALAVGVPAALAAGAYLVSGLHVLASWLDPFRFLSSFWWIGQSPLQSGVDVPGLLVVAAAALFVLAAAAVLLERRDLQTP